MFNFFPSFHTKPSTFLFCGIVLTLALLSCILKICFGHFSFIKILIEHRKTRAIQDKYQELFDSRENLMYHLSAAQSRGERDMARRLKKDLREIDKVKIDYIVYILLIVVIFCFI